MLYTQLLLRWNCMFFSIPLHPLLKDYMMALLILCMTIIDMVILLTYTVTEGVRENLGVKLATSQELPEKIIGVIFLS